MNDAREVTVAALVLLTACLACKGKFGRSGTGSATSASSAAAPGSTCTSSTKEVHGSLHAEVAFDTSMDPPKSKRKESYQCGGRDALALFLEYPTAAAASSACNLVGAKLWGRQRSGARKPRRALDEGRHARDRIR